MARVVEAVEQHDRGAVEVHAEAEVPVAVEAEDGRVISWEEARTIRRHLPTRIPVVAVQSEWMEALGALREVVVEMSAAAALLSVLAVVLPVEVTRCTCMGHNHRHRTYPG